MLIGFAGKKGSGKTLAAGIAIFKTGGMKESFAEPLKNLLEEVYSFTYEQLYGDAREVVDPRYGKSPRQLLQEIGTDVLRRYDSDIWVYRVASLWEGCTHVFDDVRFPNEAKAIQDAGGKVIYLDRQQVGEGDSHLSENAIGPGDCDLTIINTKTIEALEEKVLEVLNA